MRIEFTVPGEPVSKARARFTKTGRSYTPQHTLDGERAVADAFRAAAPDHEPGEDVRYRVEAVFYCGTRQRRDVDNMLKLICDGLNGVAWVDDNQVTEANVAKCLVPKTDARTVVTITELGPLERPMALCEHCGEPYPTYDSWAGKRKYCTSDCRYAARRAKNKRTCEACGKSFQSTKPAKFCSITCSKAGHLVVQPCAWCGVDVRRFASWAGNGRPYCCDEHRVAYHRANRAKNAKGTCATCGGSTSKKTYRQCRACRIAAAVEGIDREHER